MSKVKELKKEVEFFKDLQYLTEAYEEIAVMRMKKIRNAILSSRRFMERLTDVFFDVKRSYQKQVEQLFETDDDRMKKENKKLAILISPDSKLYGDLAEKVFKLFLKKALSYDEVITIGKIGVEFVKEQRLNKRLKMFLLNKFKLTKSDLHLLARKFMDFEQVDVYHPKFR